MSWIFRFNFCHTNEISLMALSRKFESMNLITQLICICVQYTKFRAIAPMGSTNPAVEIIDFKPPCGNQKILFVSGIPCSLDEIETEEKLRIIFSRYGLIHCILVRTSSPAAANQDDRTTPDNTKFMYALVFFYSARDASHALANLSGQLFVKGQCLKIKYCSKMSPKPGERGDHLYVIQAKELANHYLGFNGWTTEIVKFEACELTEREENVDIDQEKVEYLCVMRLKVPDHGLVVEGVGNGSGTWSRQDLSTKASTICKAKKYAHQRALETAFSKILLVVLPNGKVFAEVDTRTLSPLDHLGKLDMENLLEVKDLDEAPPSGDEDDFIVDNTADLDDLNVQVLAKLHDS